MIGQNLSKVLEYTHGMERTFQVKKICAIINDLDFLEESIDDLIEKDIIEKIIKRLLITLKKETNKNYNRLQIKKERIKDFNEKLKNYDVKNMLKEVEGRCVICGYRCPINVQIPSYRNCPECGYHGSVFPVCIL